MWEKSLDILEVFFSIDRVFLFQHCAFIGKRTCWTLATFYNFTSLVDALVTRRQYSGALRKIIMIFILLLFLPCHRQHHLVITLSSSSSPCHHHHHHVIIIITMSSSSSPCNHHHHIVITILFIMTGWVGGLSTTLSGDLVSLESWTRWMKMHSCSGQPSNIKLLKSVFLPLLLLCQENVGLHNTKTAYALIMNMTQTICPSTQVKCKNLRRAPFKAQNVSCHPIWTTTIIYDTRVLVLTSEQTCYLSRASRAALV